MTDWDIAKVILGRLAQEDRSLYHGLHHFLSGIEGLKDQDPNRLIQRIAGILEALDAIRVQERTPGSIPARLTYPSEVYWDKHRTFDGYIADRCNNMSVMIERLYYYKGDNDGVRGCRELLARALDRTGRLYLRTPKEVPIIFWVEGRKLKEEPYRGPAVLDEISPQFSNHEAQAAQVGAKLAEMVAVPVDL